MRRGSRHSEATKKKISIAKSGPNNHNWKGGFVGNAALHMWVRDHKSRPDDNLCEVCHKIPFYDLANITGIYSREFNNWQYQCRRCHYIGDGRGRRVSASLRGVTHKDKGVPHSPETRAKISRVWMLKRMSRLIVPDFS